MQWILLELCKVLEFVDRQRCHTAGASDLFLFFTSMTNNSYIVDVQSTSTGLSVSCDMLGLQIPLPVSVLEASWWLWPFQFCLGQQAVIKSTSIRKSTVGFETKATILSQHMYRNWCTSHLPYSFHQSINQINQSINQPTNQSINTWSCHFPSTHPEPGLLERLLSVLSTVSQSHVFDLSELLRGSGVLTCPNQMSDQTNKQTTSIKQRQTNWILQCVQSINITWCPETHHHCHLQILFPLHFLPVKCVQCLFNDVYIVY